ncbi:MAG: BON domain-containing protein, partial [Armatimonadetes bacterium]|nr:BON domain-containing protein [Armatimonadota bacterium]
MMNGKEIPEVTAVSVPNGESVVVTAEESPVAVQIRDALLAESSMAGANLEVRMRDDHAVLSGTVVSEEQKETALNIAGRYVGRDRVIDDIQT